MRVAALQPRRAITLAPAPAPVRTAVVTSFGVFIREGKRWWLLSRPTVIGGALSFAAALALGLSVIEEMARAAT